MQKEFLIETRSVADEKGTLLNLKYYLIEEEPPQSAAPSLPHLYQEIHRRTPRGRRDRKHAPGLRLRTFYPPGAKAAHPECSYTRLPSGNRG